MSLGLPEGLVGNAIVTLELIILLYFCLINGFYALTLYIASRQLTAALREENDVRLQDLVGLEIHKPISILVPAYNEEATVVASVRSMLDLHYPTFELIVINDGSRDDTLRVLTEAFNLHPVRSTLKRSVPHQPVRGAYRSVQYANLLVIDKENGGKADALNAGLNEAQYPLFCAVDADSLLDAQALLRVSAAFAHDPELVAAGGTIRILNASKVERGTVMSLRVPSGWLERFQIIEYTRAFLAGRATFSAAHMLLIISGAFGIFRREDVLSLGGYHTGTVGEDMELVVRIHRRMRELGRSYRIRYFVDPICWTQVPNDFTTLRGQRDRWQRGLWETLWRHRAMLFNPRYGRMGLVAVPYYWLFEALAPILEVLGYVLFVVLLLLGRLDPAFAIAFLALALLYGIMVSVAAFGIEVFMRKRYTRLSDRWLLLGVAIVENLGYRQLLAVVRVLATFGVVRRAGTWGEMRRDRIG